MPEGFRFEDTMVRAGQSSEKAALIYQHSDESLTSLLARIWHATAAHHGQQKGPGL
ncbi:hypothetical protein [Streptomyces coeruleorubidus]|uniref:hypothetical protein n=1 Tax=Streptomyces coeruleorubidus TaxID=116188 RepID=UPI00365BE48B